MGETFISTMGRYRSTSSSSLVSTTASLVAVRVWAKLTGETDRGAAEAVYSLGDELPECRDDLGSPGGHAFSRLRISQ